MTTRSATPPSGVTIRPLVESDLGDADRIVRLAFGTFLGLPDPAAFMGDASYVATRWRANPEGTFAAEIDGALVGSNFATRWGHFGFFGPLSVRPDLWDRGVAKLLMEPVMGCFERWSVRHAGLFTFAQSVKHVGLYQRFGFHPRFLTAILVKAPGREGGAGRWTRFSESPGGEHDALLDAARRLTGEIDDGLDVSAEIGAVAEQGLGDTILTWDEAGLAGLAVCHVGPGTEAGSGTCYVKFGAARPGPDAAGRFERLLAACEELASAGGLSRVVAGVNTARHEAYARMRARGYRTEIQGIAMHRPNEPGFCRPGAFVIDDWR